MIKAIVFDFSRVILDTVDKSYTGSLNGKHDKLKKTPNYNLYDHFDLNEELLNLAKKLKDKYSLYVFTTGHIHNESEVQEKISGIFKKLYSLEDIGGKKDNPESFKKVANLIATSPEEILFIDDTEENVEAAKLAGFQTIRYLKNSQLFEEIQEKLK